MINLISTIDCTRSERRNYQKVYKKLKKYLLPPLKKHTVLMDDMKHASLRRFALPWSGQVAARIRTWWLNWTVALWKIHAACSKLWLIGHEARRPSCNHKSSTGSQDQQHKNGGFRPQKERFLAHTYHGLINFQRKMWDILRVETSLVSREQWLIKRFTTTMGVFKSDHRKLYRLGNKKNSRIFF